MKVQEMLYVLMRITGNKNKFDLLKKIKSHLHDQDMLIMMIEILVHLFDYFFLIDFLVFHDVLLLFLQPKKKFLKIFVFMFKLILLIIDHVSFHY